jgi:ketosteroid isomerase-like protein
MRRLVPLTVLITLAASPPAHAQSPAPAARESHPAHADIDAFNRDFAEATRRMDTRATLALWDEDGVSLLPSTRPIVGKAAIAKFLNDVTASLAGARMTKFDSQCFDVQVAGDWASEWCNEHQLVSMPAGKPPFNGYGKMLLVLHRNDGGQWRLREEMWNQALAPDSVTH